MNTNINELSHSIDMGRRWLFAHGYIGNIGELCHHGVKGQKWGVRRYQNKDGTLTPAGRQRRKFTQTSLSYRTPKIQDSKGDFIYKKGTVVGRYGKQKLDEGPMYLFTNEIDEAVYKRRIGGERQRFVTKKDIKTPQMIDQIYELYKYTKDPYVLDDYYEYWKDNINQDGKIAQGFFEYMTGKGYDALIDIRNAGGVADDPILVIDPKVCLEEI